MRIKPVFYSLLLFFFSACTNKHTYTVVPPVPSGPFTAYHNVLYGTDTVQQIIDVYLPQVRDTVHTPVVILIHGGGWLKGDKTDFYGLGLDTLFTANGWAVVNMNYRLDPIYPYPDCINDVGNVMNFIKKMAPIWKIDPNRVCLMGRSSGSHLALLYAYAMNAEQRVKVVIDGFGPTDFTDSSVIDESIDTLVQQLLGPYATNQLAWHNASPIFYMTNAVPTVIMQGNLDETVLPLQSEMLADSLMTRHIPYLYIPWIGDGHGWDQVKWNENKMSVVNWVKSYL